MVSYMCQSQLSSDMLPSDAPMPPCAATVCERVGKHLRQHRDGQTRFGELQRGAHARAARADDDRVEFPHGQRSWCSRSPPHSTWMVQPT